jgi:Holliday junction resolvase RusA-like endonuclease
MRRLVMPGNPVAKGRPRCGKQGAYTPQKTRDAEELIGWCWKDVHGANPVSGLVRVYLTFVEGPGQRAQDIDNLTKLVLDALNGVAWEDDTQVRAVHAELFRGRRSPMTRMIVEEMIDGDIDAPEEDPPAVDGG